MLEWRICNPLLPREDNSSFWSWVNREFTAAGTGSLCQEQPLPSLLVFPRFCPDNASPLVQSPTLGAVVGLQGQHTLKCSGSSLLWLQHPWKGMAWHSHEQQGAMFSSRSRLPLSGQVLVALALADREVPFPCSAHPWQKSWEWLPVLAFGGI